MTKILIATGNQGKIREIKKILADINIEALSLKDLSIDCNVIEDGKNYEENAYKKAETAAKISGMISISDDSGLEVKALKGVPGIHSARFAGKNKTDTERNLKLLNMMSDIPNEKRKARFVCVAALVIPDKTGTKLFFRGECEGIITQEIAGKTGFGYDPVFFIPEYGKTFAELGEEIKNKISHRARAFAKVTEYLKKIYQ